MHFMVEGMAAAPGYGILSRWPSAPAGPWAPARRVLSTHVGGGSYAVSWLFGVPLDRRKAPLYVRWRLLRDEVRTRLVPQEDCYLPGDFPETAFQAWA